MTTTVTKPYDVFVSHAASDGVIAAEIADILGSAGLETFYAGVVPSGADLGDAIWEALAECRAMIAIVSPDTVTHAMGMVELGAAAAWNKPVFVVINGPLTTRLPEALRTYPVYPLSRFEDVIRAIQTAFQPLTEDELEALTDAYQALKIPADQLNQFPEALHKLSARFNKHARKPLSEERLLSEILSMRKSGQLPRLR